MTDIEQKRAYVAELYSSPRWKRRVAKMSDAQVIAIYMREQDTDHHKSDKPKQESDDDELPF